MTRALAIFLSFGVGLLGGCGRDSRDGAEPRIAMPASLPGVYAGEFPCSNCAAIEATLWLRPDGGFVLRQRLLDDAATPSSPALSGPSTTYGLGRWVWEEVSAEVVLRGRGPERRFAVRDEGKLQLRSASAPVLARDAMAPRFVDRLLLDGESAVSEAGASFKECSTGLTFSVVDAGAYRELRRQHRRMNPRGKVALTTVEGHLVAAGSGSTTRERLVVDQFIAIKPGTGC